MLLVSSSKEFHVQMWFLMQWSRRFVFCLLSSFGKQSWGINIVKGNSLSLQNICTVIMFCLFLQPVWNPLIYAQCICLLVFFCSRDWKKYLDVISYHTKKKSYLLSITCLLPKVLRLKELTERWTLKGEWRIYFCENVDFQFQLTGTPAARLFFLIQPITCLIATGCRCPGDEYVRSIKIKRKVRKRGLDCKITI